MTAEKSCAAAWPIFHLIVRSDYIPRIQEVQASIYHADSRDAGGLGPCLTLSSSGPPGCPYTSEMREWLEWKGQ